MTLILTLGDCPQNGITVIFWYLFTSLEMRKIQSIREAQTDTL